MSKPFKSPVVLESNILYFPTALRAVCSQQAAASLAGGPRDSVSVLSLLLLNETVYVDVCAHENLCIESGLCAPQELCVCMGVCLSISLLSPFCAPALLHCDPASLLSLFISPPPPSLVLIDFGSCPSPQPGTQAHRAMLS